MDAQISVIVPVYLVETDLPGCIDSILAQTYTNIQIILVDDGSPDRSGAICDAYAARHPNILVIHKQNGGLSDARNAGIERASGDYLMFVDSDDCIEPDMAEKMLRALRDADADLCICNFQYDCTQAPEKAALYQNTLPVADGVLTGREILAEKVFVGSGVWYIIACNKLYRRRLFDELRFPVGKLHEDEFIFHEIMLRCERVACIRDPLYHYMIHAGSIMHSDYSVRRFDGIEATFQRAEVLIRNGFPAAAVCRTLERGLNLFKEYYASSMVRDAACRKRYRSLLRFCRRMAFPRCFDSSVPFSQRLILLCKICFPSLCWTIMQKRQTPHN